MSAADQAGGAGDGARGFGVSGTKHDGGKPRMGMLGMLRGPLSEVVRVLEHGEAKYGVQNWKRVENAKQRYLDALERHSLAANDGEVRDPDSGLYTLAHVVCCGAFALWFQLLEDAAGK